MRRRALVTMISLSSAVFAVGEGRAKALSSPLPSFTVVGQTATGFDPPDSHGAVSASFVVTTVNNTINVKNRSGTVLLSEGLSAFWAPFRASSLTDPQVHFDPFGQRFIVSEVDGYGTPNGRLLLAVSQSADPTAGFFFFAEPASPGGHTWLDQPQTGFNKKWVVVTRHPVPNGLERRVGREGLGLRQGDAVRRRARSLHGQRHR